MNIYVFLNEHSWHCNDFVKMFMSFLWLGCSPSILSYKRHFLGKCRLTPAAINLYKCWCSFLLDVIKGLCRFLWTTQLSKALLTFAIMINHIVTWSPEYVKDFWYRFAFILVTISSPLLSRWEIMSLVYCRCAIRSGLVMGHTWSQCLITAI